MLEDLSKAITLVWIVLFAGSAVSWFLVPEGTQVTSLVPGIAILSIAFFKVRLILLYFMELRFSPQLWRGMFEAWTIAAWGAVVYLYVA